MNFPEGLVRRFRPLEQLSIPSARGHLYYLVEGFAPDVQRGPCFLKVTPYSDLSERIETAIRERTDSDHLTRSIFTLRDQARHFTVTPYRSIGTLRSLMTTDVPSPDTIRNVVLQLNSALKQLHGIGIAHCDIKPSNILITESNPGQVGVSIADFGYSTEVTDGVPRARGYTLRYAAPQMIIPNVPLSGSADFWSLGVLLYEWVTGSHMFTGVSDSIVYEQLPSFRPDMGLVDNTETRALIAGLLQFDMVDRFGAADVDRWLENDPQTISRGLICADEPATSNPLVLEQRRIYSAVGLGQALLEVNRPELIGSPEVLDWVTRDLGRDDIAAEMQRQAPGVGESSLGFLQICSYLWPNMPPVWQGQALSRTLLADHCRRALSGNQDSQDWLWAFWDSPGVVAYFESGAHRNPAFIEVSAILADVRASLEKLDVAWEAIRERGAPIDTRPPAEQELPLVMLTVLDEEYARSLRAESENLFAPEALLLRADWFYVFGASPSLELEELQVLVQLDRLSRLQALAIDNVSQLASLDSGEQQDSVLLFRSQRSLVSGLIVSPGADIAHFRNGGDFNPDNLRSVFQSLRETIWDPSVETMRWLIGRARQLIARGDGERDSGESGQQEEQDEPALTTDDIVVPSYDTYLIPLVPGSTGADSPLGYTSYLMRVSWNANAERNIDLVLRAGRWPFRRRLLRLARLPHRGHIVLSIDRSCEVLLREKVGMISTFRFPPLRLRFRNRVESLIKARRPDYPTTSLLTVSTSVSANSPSFTLPQDLKPVTDTPNRSSGIQSALIPVMTELIPAMTLNQSTHRLTRPSISDREFRRILSQVHRRKKQNRGERK